MNFENALKKHVLIMDGAMGTMALSLRLPDSAFGGPEFKMLTDLLTFSRPADLENIHLEYLRAGANIIETDTFGASPLRLKEFDFSRIDPADIRSIPRGLDLARADFAEIAWHLNVEACRAARRAMERYRASPEHDGRPLFVAGSIGPSNYVVSSTQANLKRATFAEIEDNFRIQVAGLIDGGADVLLFETQQDILETKAAILGAKKACREKGKTLPIMAQVTVDAFGKMQIFNTDILAAYVAVAHMGIAAFGINCNVGPELMKETVKRMARFCNLPFSVVPNAGQPVSEDGKTCYKLTPEDMAETMAPFVKESGAAIVGGCCGTTPEHIRALRRRLGDSVPLERPRDTRVFVSGPQEAALLDSSKGLARIGERLNARGSKKVRDAVERDGEIRMDVLEEVVSEQVKDLGIEIIDVCMDSNIVETEKALPAVIRGLTADFKGAMCIDSFSVEALEQGIQAYPGRPIVNSISLETYAEGVSKLDAVLSTTKDHGALYIALVNGPEGPGQTAEEKYALAAEIVRQARDKHGVGPDRILIDVNAYPIGSESVEGLNFCAETLKCLPMIKGIHPDLMTTIGVGNLTNGLAQKPYMRQVLTSVFLHEAREKGLDCAILNPQHYVPAESLPPEDVELARKAILDHDMNAFAELERIALTKKTGETAKKADYAGLSAEQSVCRKIMDGFKQKEDGVLEHDGGEFPYHDRIVLEAAQVIERREPLEFIGQYLVKTMRELGDRFGRGEVSLPHLLKSADVMRNVMGFLEAYMRFKSGAEPGAIAYKGVVVIGTVYQDVHSIGKDLAKTLLENYGYRVVDLGVQTPLEKFIQTARQENADAIGMSALLVQTSNHMIAVARMAREQNYPIPLLVGGAPVNDRHAGYVAMHGQNDLGQILDNVFYCESGMEGVNVMSALMDKESRASFLEQNKAKLVREYQRAKGIQDEKQKLLATLARRKVDFKRHEPVREGFGIHRVEFKLSKLGPSLDSKSLYSLNWKFGKQSGWKRHGMTLERLKELEREWMEKAEASRWIVPKARFALLPAQSEGDEAIVYDPELAGKELGRIRFNPVVGKGRKDVFSVAQYFYPKSSGRMDAIGLLIATAGDEALPAIEEFKARHDSESALYLQGLCDRIAEDLAEYIHQLLFQRAGLAKEKPGQRYSPGYAALEDLTNNKTIYEILQAQDLGIALTGANQFHPPSVTAAAVCFHKDAGYS
ncbi:MAG: homocysteine S-methyltransferase family protein [Nitrospinae bacterium]|nr:homocysteine S-methyltransferase family protein [Nitrospinota bacterium]